jgi:hypothetical protein
MRLGRLCAELHAARAQGVIRQLPTNLLQSVLQALLGYIVPGKAVLLSVQDSGMLVRPLPEVHSQHSRWYMQISSPTNP